MLKATASALALWAAQAMLAVHSLDEIWLRQQLQCTEFVAATAAGTTGYGTQICMTIALKYCKAAPAIARSYLSIVWGLLGGYILFKEVSHCPARLFRRKYWATTYCLHLQQFSRAVVHAWPLQI